VDTTKIQKFIAHNDFLRRGYFNLVNSFETALMGMFKSKDILKIVTGVRNEREMLLMAEEAYFLYTTALTQRELPGVMAEVGAYKGASSKLICEAKGKTPFHIFDTFEGLPKMREDEKKLFSETLFKSDYEDVKNYLSAYSNVYFHKGVFPETASVVEDKQFSFIHSDVDLYDGTLACLEFFYPRMVRGGVFVSHDYTVAAGVKQAFTEFFTSRPERVIELPTSQCMFIKN
jgi:hypothetical protein